MSLNRLFDVVQEIKDTADVRAAFGEPQVFDDMTIIPVAKVAYGIGLGFGSDEAEDEPVATDGAGGGGGGVYSTPLGALVITPDGVRFEGSLDSTKVALAGMAMGAWVVYQVAKTLRAICCRE